MSEPAIERSFWATDGCPNIPQISLGLSALRRYLPEGWQHLVYLTQLANALRSLQRRDGSFLDDGSRRRLIDESAGALEAAAAASPEEEIAALLRLRAECLRSGSTERAALALAGSENDRLVVLCGPLATWTNKSDACLYSACVAMSEDDLTGRVRALERSLPELARCYEDVLGLNGLTMAATSRFTASDLALCGGEANGFPKHFTYFLPEDEGHRGLFPRKTVVFSNVYLGRVRRISVPLLRRFWPEGTTGDEHIGDAMIALTWFRGHDIGHSWRHPAAAFAKLRELGRLRSYAMQEALCDVLGYLAAIEPWRPAGVRREAVICFYLAEMLRFVARPNGVHPDFEASHLILSYLVRNHFVSLDPDAQILGLDFDRFHLGMLELARRLAGAVLGGNMQEAWHLAGEYGVGSAGAAGGLGRLIQEAANLYYDIQYINEE